MGMYRYVWVWWYVCGDRWCVMCMHVLGRVASGGTCDVVMIGKGV
ncbi:hypothetical protein [Bacteroides gallinarum]|nr:hypothetical protein [Bacteroides gallinarum]